MKINSIRGNSITLPYNPTFVKFARDGLIVPLKRMIRNGLNINSLDDNGVTALYASTEVGNLKLMQYLLENGAEIDFHDPNGKSIEKTPFLLAGAKGLDKELELLIKYEPNVEILNHYGGTALIPAAEKGHVSTVKILLEQTDIDINHINNLGWTALLETVLLNDGTEVYQQIVKLLLEFGADKSIPDKNGVTALDHAKIMGLTEISKLLEI